MASNEDLVDILQHLDSADHTSRKEVCALIEDSLDSEKLPWLVKALVDNFYKSKSENVLNILAHSRDSNVKILLDKIKDGLSHSKIDALDLIGKLILQEPTWIHRIPSHGVFSAIIKVLKVEQPITVLIAGVLPLAAILPFVPVLIEKHLPDLFEACFRLVKLLGNRPAGVLDVHWLHLHMCVHALLLRLYAMYPCKTLHFLRAKFSRTDTHTAFSTVLKPMLLQFRMHPNLVIGHKDFEAKTEKWRALEPQDVVVNCSDLEADSELWFEQRPISPERHVCSKCSLPSSVDVSSASHKRGVQSTSKDPQASLLQEQLRLMEEGLSAWSPSEASGWTTPPRVSARVSNSPEMCTQPPPTSPYRPSALTVSSHGGSARNTPAHSDTNSPAPRQDANKTPAKNKSGGLQRDTGLHLGTPVTTPGGPDSVPPSPGVRGSFPAFKPPAASCKALTFQSSGAGPVDVGEVLLASANTLQPAEPVHSAHVKTQDDQQEPNSSAASQEPTTRVEDEMLDQEVGEIISLDTAVDEPEGPASSTEPKSQSSQTSMSASESATPAVDDVVFKTQQEQETARDENTVERSQSQADAASRAIDDVHVARETMERFVREARHRLSESEVVELSPDDVTHHPAPRSAAHSTSPLQTTVVSTTTTVTTTTVHQPAVLALTEAEARQQLPYLPLLSVVLPRWFCSHCRQRGDRLPNTESRASAALQSEVPKATESFSNQMKLSLVRTPSNATEEIAWLKAKLQFQRSELQLEQQRRKALAKRNRRALAKISERMQQEEQLLAMQSQVSLMTEDMEKLKLENKLLREQDRQMQDLKYCERKTMLKRISVLEEEQRRLIQETDQLRVSESEHKDAYGKQRADFQSQANKVFELEQELRTAREEAALANAAKREVEDLRKRLVMVTEMCRRYQDSLRSIDALHQTKAQHEMIMKDMSAVNADAQSKIIELRRQVDAAHARLQQEDQLVKEKELAIFQQKQLLERTKQTHKQRIEVLEERHACSGNVIMTLETKCMDLRAELEATRHTISQLRQKNASEASAARPIPTRPTVVEAPLGLSPAQSVGSGSGVVAYSPNRSAFTEYRPNSSAEDSSPDSRGGPTLDASPSAGGDASHV